MNWKQGVLAISMSLALPITALADGLDEGRIRELVLETIRANPEIVMEAVAILERKQAEAENNALADILSAIRDRLEDDANAPVLGNPEGDVTVVEFFDYNCPYCRRAMEPVQGLLEADPNVRLVYREWPILGEGSVFAARAALAARKQGKYDEFHWALMAMNGRADEASVLRVASEIGLDVEQLRSDMEGSEIDEHIRNSAELAQALGFNGTPSFVIGNELAPGLVQQPQLMEMVESVRAQE
ncbi:MULTISPECIES: DsbA family protein [Pseudophaeobacter]|jgi:protein-disulfide isomerase|nr:DsbA family protein [Pseudophaeobacter sp. EL27]